MRTLIRASCAPFVAIFILIASSNSVQAVVPYVGTDLYTLTSQSGIVLGGRTFAVDGQVVGQSADGHAAVWTGPAGAVTDLHPNGYDYSEATATDGARQVGDVFQLSLFIHHAAMWSGTAGSFVDLHPTNLSALNLLNSYANGVYGTQVVGYGDSPTSGYALLWNGSAGSAVDLTPTNLGPILRAGAVATDGINQVGYVEINSSDHPVLWSGTADSAVDLTPTNLDPFNVAILGGIGGGQEVGYGIRFAEDATHPNSYFHALLWTGSSTLGVDLNPTNLTGYADGGAVALATNGSLQVGYGRKDENTFDPSDNALMWSGAPDTAVDLNVLLPFLAKSSTASSVDAQGNIFGIATDADGNVHAVEWSPVPEPSTFLLAAVALFVVARWKI